MATYLLKLSGNLLGQSVINIWHYTSVSGSPVASDLGGIFEVTVIPALMAIGSSDLTYTDLEVKNIASGTDYYVNSFSLKGTRNGVSSSPFNAWGFKLNPGNITVKAGGKRIGGVARDDMYDGDPVASMLSPLATAALWIGKALVTTAGNFRPVLESIRCNKDPVTHKCNGTYQAPTYPQINSGTFDVGTTQSSRKWRTSP